MNRFSFARTFAIFLTLSLVARIVPIQAATDPKPSGSQSGPASTGLPPAIEMLEVKYDFGELLEEGEVSHDFHVKNKGSGPLNIDRVSTS